MADGWRDSSALLLHFDDNAAVGFSRRKNQLMRRARRNVHNIAFSDNLARSAFNSAAFGFAIGRCLRVLQLSSGNECSATVRDKKDVVKMCMNLSSAAAGANG